MSFGFYGVWKLIDLFVRIKFFIGDLLLGVEFKLSGVEILGVKESLDKSGGKG